LHPQKHPHSFSHPQPDPVCLLCVPGELAGAGLSGPPRRWNRLPQPGPPSAQGESSDPLKQNQYTQPAIVPEKTGETPAHPAAVMTRTTRLSRIAGPAVHKFTSDEILCRIILQKKRHFLIEMALFFILLG